MTHSIRGGIVNLQKVLGANIRSHRKAQGFSQMVLAARIGINYTTLGLIERGQLTPSLKRITVIAEALNVDPAVFFGVDTVPADERGTLISDIYVMASRMNVKQLVIAKRTLQALSGS